LALDAYIPLYIYVYVLLDSVVNSAGRQLE